MRLPVTPLVVACVALVTAVAPRAQDAPRAFEVASIKPRVGDAVVASGPSAPDRFEWFDATLLLLIRHAYDLFQFQVIGGPEWIDSRRWDVSAKAAGPARRAEMQLMLRTLLEQRFALKARRETRELPIYELVLARADGRLGPKIKAAALDCTPFLTGQRPMAESPTDPVSRCPVCSSGGAFSPGGLLTPRLNGQPIAGLVRTLEATLQRRIVDKTGLTGNYDIELSYLDESLAEPGVRTSEGPALFTALQEQLGLKLESARGPVEVLVVEHAAEPTAN